jgi:hypothetical protein
MDFDRRHVCEGRSLIRDGSSDLEDTPGVWRRLWRESRAALLAEWIEENPGTRPEAFYRFDCGRFPDQTDDESQPEYLERLGLIGESEREAIRQKALELIAHNRNRSPYEPRTNFIPDAYGYVAYAIRFNLLQPDECPAFF